MPRSAEEILARADELARQFEDYEPAPSDVRDAGALREVAAAFARLAASQRDLANAVHAARAEGHSWAAIGAMLGTSGEAARQRYGTAANRSRDRRASA
jgi:DNA-binding helix-hairpin-helix protein with protein kinase domain